MNAQKELDHTIEQLTQEKKVPTLLLHSCCAPCSSYVLDYLSSFFSITVFYYNPNIYPKEEYQKRLHEQRRLLTLLPTEHPVSFLEGAYDPGCFYQAVQGLESEKEGGKRCRICYELRLREAAKIAKEGSFDYFTTTLTVSPYKDATALNNIGMNLSASYEVPYLVSDFKKKNGYQRSIQLSKTYGLYRQHYCGCEFSLKGME